MILAGSVLIGFITMVCDLKRGYVSEKYTFFSIILAMIAIIAESSLVYFRVSASGIFIGIGMIILLCTNLLKTIKNIQKVESRRQRAELNKRRKQMETMSLQMMRTLSTTIEAKDEYTRGHSYRVAEYAALIAEELGWDKKEIRNLKNAAHLHDIGKIGIPDAILNKPGRLTDEEYAVMKTHVTRGGEILKDFTMIDNVSVGALYHHERYDGSGYCVGLKGEEIPLDARIIGIADAFDAMTANRVYRKQLDIDFVIGELKRCSGTQFDPKLVDILLSLIEDGTIDVEKLYAKSKEDK